MKFKCSRLFVSIFLFIIGCIFLVSKDKVRAEETDSYELSKYESKAHLINQETKEELPGKTPRINLRSTYSDLSLSQVHSLPDISIRKMDDRGFYGHSTIKHSYEKKTIEGDEVVIDHATGLMWHQSGSRDYMMWNNARIWIRNLNKRGYAGHHDWRLPTLEEAVSLLGPVPRNNLFIDPVFNVEQWGIWSGDKLVPGGVWSVYFSLGNVRYNIKNRFVRPVRLLE